MPVLADPRTVAGPLTAADLMTARQHSTGRIFAAGLDQQGRYPTRSRAPWHDTVATNFGSADALGDDQAERHSGWGALQECAVEGGRHREPTSTFKPSLWARFVRWLSTT